MNINDVSFSKSLLSATVHQRGAGRAWTLDYLSPLCTPEPSLFLLPHDAVCEFCTDHSVSCTGDRCYRCTLCFFFLYVFPPSIFLKVQFKVITNNLTAKTYQQSYALFQRVTGEKNKKKAMLHVGLKVTVNQKN